MYINIFYSILENILNIIYILKLLYKINIFKYNSYIIIWNNPLLLLLLLISINLIFILSLIFLLGS